MDAVGVRILSWLEVKWIETQRADRRAVDAGGNHKQIIAELVHRRESTVFRLGRLDHEERDTLVLPEMSQEMVHRVGLAGASEPENG